MIISNLSDIQKADFRKEAVPIPELAADAEILVREMSGGEQAEFQSRMSKDSFKNNEKAIVAYMLAISAVREDGLRLFENEEEAGKFIDAVPAGVINRLNKAIWNLNNGQTEKNS